MNPEQSPIITTENTTITNTTFMNQVYAWMTLALIITGGIAYELSTFPYVIIFLYQKHVFLALLVMQFFFVAYLSIRISKLSPAAAITHYLLFAITQGITFSLIFAAFSINTISEAFFLTAFSFSGLSLYGLITRRDLGPIGSFCMAGLFGIVGFAILAWIFPSILTNSTEMAMDVLGIVIFAGLTAWDTQKIKNLNVTNTKNNAVRGALTLYLDFINLFLLVLSFYDDRRR